MNHYELNGIQTKADPVDSTAEQLELFSKSPIDAIRQRIAANSKTPVHVLESLASDPCAEVRMAVALNKNCPPSLVSRITAQENPAVKR
jgi:hypothetical protein